MACWRVRGDGGERWRDSGALSSRLVQERGVDGEVGRDGMTAVEI